MLKYFLPALRLTSSRTTVTYVYPWATILNSIANQLHETIVNKLHGWTDMLIFQQRSRMIQSELILDVNGTISMALNDNNNTSVFDPYDNNTSIGYDKNTDELLSPSIIYMAVPKSKVSRSKKRMKTTVQKRIPMKHHIVVDNRTGEVTLRHRLPFNWKDYLPSVDLSSSSTTTTKAANNNESKSE